MARRVLFSTQARADFDDLYSYIADNAGPVIADAYTTRLDRYVLSFGEFPERGTRSDHIRPGLRITSFERRITIAFTVNEDAVIILRLLYAGRSLLLPD
ncbi:Plasmid stabilization system protein ParE [Methylobacterium sp. 174MFSha1.1]|uniref:type II toxin-antitoxin system RelE/ParE family toxin n=1 Tax=Methylobacterium sp. 174MFSha1.1 TaxID=1502749 RepID=UPI0008E09AE8|nr:type II toxin-antitoxin system RelE/ParE family toxin [Methylobacterium sp. 174MFSha1.1]SFU41993.1 Plasmid stabilization system protein ParE [Methylobacterium sp. 174MFSha1.1]